MAKYQDLSRALFSDVLLAAEKAFRVLEQRVPSPKRMPWKDGFVFRYQERTIEQAIVQKLARVISGLHAVTVLHDRGLYQEQGMIQRALDELEEDVLFLSLAVSNSDVTKRHRDFLDFFYAEEFENPADIVGSHKSRPTVPREKVRAYISRHMGEGETQANIVGKIIAKAYSGFIHAASPHIMDMYGGNPARFDVSGQYHSHFRTSAARDALNYFYRALVAFAFAANAFKDGVLFDTLYKEASRVEKGIRQIDALNVE